MPLPSPLPATGFGLPGMTWRPVVTPNEQAFAAMKTAITNDATIWSSSSIYGMAPEEPTAGLALLHRYFSKYPEDANKVTLLIWACCDSKTLAPLCDRDSVRASVEECNRILGGAKKIDIFGPARMDSNVPVEETVGALKELHIPILTYSPLGYGFLTGQVKTLNDIPKGDIRHMFGRFQPQVQGSHSSPFRLNRDFCILITSRLEFPQESRVG